MGEKEEKEKENDDEDRAAMGRRVRHLKEDLSGLRGRSGEGGKGP